MPAIFILFGFLITFMARGILFLWGVDTDAVCAEGMAPVVLGLVSIGLYVFLALDTLNGSESRAMANFVTNSFKLSLVFVGWPLFMSVFWAIDTYDKLATKYYR